MSVHHIDPREVANARYGRDHRVRTLVAQAAGGQEVDLTDEHPNVVRHVATALSLLAALRMSTHAPARLDMCTWRTEAGVLTFTCDAQAHWVDVHAARLVAAAAASHELADKRAWFDLWDAAPPATWVPLAHALGRAVHAPLVVEREGPIPPHG